MKDKSKQPNKKEESTEDIFDPNEISIIYQDPLADSTRRERKSLLITGFIGLIIAKVEILPSKISWLGIDFTEIDKNNFYLIVLGLLGYFSSAFSLYAETDLKQWIAKYHHRVIGLYQEMFFSKNKSVSPEYKRQNWRITFDILTPIIVSWIAGGSLVNVIQWSSEYYKLLLIIPVYFIYRLFRRLAFFLFIK